MKRFRADLHIHTALSPCSTAEMTPPAIVRAARLKGLRMIAICDHNATGNVAAVQEAAGRDLTVIAGMEITTAEEVHVIGLFPDVESACEAGDAVKATLPEVDPTRRKLGEQLLMNAGGDIVGEETKMLAAASQLDLRQAVDLIKGHNGLAIPAHVDRPSFGVIGQLGFVPTDVRFDAIELSAAGTVGKQAELASLGLPILVSSDSHFLSEVGEGATRFEMEEPTFDELVSALRGIGGRSCGNA